MDNFSKLNGTFPVPPVSDAVWKIQKKRRTGDKKNRNGKKEEKNNEAKNDRTFTTAREKLITDSNHDFNMEKEIGYDNIGKKGTIKRKIDLTI